MKIRSLIAAGVILGSLVVAASAFAAVKTYQVTGPVLESSPTMIAVQKGKDRWEIAVDASSGVPADLKVGDKVTIEYRMTATSVTVKGAGKAAGKTAAGGAKGGKKKAK